MGSSSNCRGYPRWTEFMGECSFELHKRMGRVSAYAISAASKIRVDLGSVRVYTRNHVADPMPVYQVAPCQSRREQAIRRCADGRRAECRPICAAEEPATTRKIGR